MIFSQLVYRILLFLVIFLFFVFLFFVGIKKFFLNKSKSMFFVREVASLYIGENQYIVVIEVDKKFFLLGVTGTSINVLHIFKKKIRKNKDSKKI